MRPSEMPHESLADFTAAIERVRALAVDRQSTLASLPTVADPNPLDVGLGTLPRSVPSQGWGLAKSMDFLLDDVAKLLNPGQAGPRYFGFVTGGVLPSALLADWFSTLYDQNIQVHLPKETFSTVIEAYTIDMVIGLLGLPLSQFSGTVTTGATSSNLLALACARERTMKGCMKRRGGGEDWSVAEHGLSAAPSMRVKVFACQAHASIKKTAAIVGIGRANVIDVGRGVQQTQNSWRGGDIGQEAAKARVEAVEFDLQRLQAELKQCYEDKEPAIVVVGMGEVVTGALSDQTFKIRALCDDYGAWLHMDAAFSAFVCLVEGYEWMSLHMSVCDSITSDGHKTLNVPYDCGLLFVRKERAGEGSRLCLLDDVCGAGLAGAPSYLAAAPSSSSSKTPSRESDAELTSIESIPSPLHRNIENSRRFRALPLYVSLLSQGRQGTKEMVERNLAFASRLRTWLEICPYYQVLTPVCPPLDASHLYGPQRWKGDWPTTIIFFRAHPTGCPIAAFSDSHQGHSVLTQAIKDTKKMYCSPGSLNGVGGVRIAVSNWSTGLDGDADFDKSTEAMLQVMEAGA